MKYKSKTLIITGLIIGTISICVGLLFNSYTNIGLGILVLLMTKVEIKEYNSKNRKP